MKKMEDNKMTNNMTALNDDMLDLVSGGTIIPYVVQSGDSVKSIAEKFHITVEQLEKWNKIDTNGVITVGQQLKIKF